MQTDRSSGSPILNFELTATPVAPYGAVLNDIKMYAAFTKHAGSGGENAVMDEEEFAACVRQELGLDNRHLASLLFRLFDVGGNGSITRVEFCARWRTIAGDDAEGRRQLCFELHDVKQQGFLDKESLRLFFMSFFADALRRCTALKTDMDEWLNGRKDGGGTNTLNGIPNYFFVGTARLKKLKLADDLQQLAQAQVSVFVDAVVKHAMKFAEPDGTLRNDPVPRSGGASANNNGFARWTTAFPGFMRWISVLPSAWMALPSAAGNARIKYVCKSQSCMVC